MIRHLVASTACVMSVSQANADSIVRPPLEMNDGVWEVYVADGLHTAQTCVITLTREMARGLYVVEDSANCPIRPIAATTGWSWGMKLYDSSGNGTVSFQRDRDHDRYTSPDGRMVIRRLSMSERVPLWLEQMLKLSPYWLTAASLSLLIIATVRRRANAKRHMSSQ